MCLICKYIYRISIQNVQSCRCTCVNCKLYVTCNCSNGPSDPQAISLCLSSLAFLPWLARGEWVGWVKLKDRVTGAAYRVCGKEVLDFVLSISLHSMTSRCPHIPSALFFSTMYSLFIYTIISSIIASHRHSNPSSMLHTVDVCHMIIHVV